MMFPVLRTNGRNLFSTLDPWAELSRDFNLFSNAYPMRVDIREEGDTLILAADVPGVAPGEVEVTVENGALTIGVTRKSEHEQNDASYLIRERHAGGETRTFRLPETADLEKIEAGLVNGVLTLRIPKKEEAKPRQIPVK